MSHYLYKIGLLIIAITISVFIVFANCSKRAPVSPEKIHPEGWLNESSGKDFHGYETFNDSTFCRKCHTVSQVPPKTTCHQCHSNAKTSPHQSGFSGTPHITKVKESMSKSNDLPYCKKCHIISLKSTTDDGTFCWKCHEGGVLIYHPQDWGSTGHIKQIRDSKWSYGRCKKCHGTDYKGSGNSNKSCYRCHTDGPTSCIRCHGGFNGDTLGMPPVDLQGDTLTTSIGVGAHRYCLSGRNLSNKIGCINCHESVVVISDSSTCIGGSKEVGIAEVVFTRSAGDSAKWDRITGKCYNVYCHGAKMNGGTNTAPLWTDVSGGQVVCGSCHSITPSTGKHSVHSETGTYKYTCNKCHFGYSKTSIDKSLHINDSLNVKFDTQNSLGIYTKPTCANIYCHSDGKGTYKSPNWFTGTAMGCGSCHGNRSSPTTLSGKHSFHIATKRFICEVCHQSASTDASGNDIISDYSKHINSQKEVKSFWDIGSKSCKNVSCHNSPTTSYKWY